MRWIADFVRDLVRGLLAVVIFGSLGWLAVLAVKDHPRIALTLGIAAAILVCLDKIEHWQMHRIVRKRCTECGRVQTVQNWQSACRFVCGRVSANGSINYDGFLISISKSQWGPYSRKQLVEMYCAEHNAWSGRETIPTFPS